MSKTNSSHQPMIPAVPCVPGFASQLVPLFPWSGCGKCLSGQSPRWFSGLQEGPTGSKPCKADGNWRAEVGSGRGTMQTQLPSPYSWIHDALAQYLRKLKTCFFRHEILGPMPSPAITGKSRGQCSLRLRCCFPVVLWEAFGNQLTNAPLLLSVTNLNLLK